MRMGTGMSGISDGYPLIRRPCHLRQNRTGNINHGLNLCVTPILFGQNGCRCNYGPVPPLFFRAPFGANGVFGYSFGPALGSHTSFEHRGGNRWSCRYICRHRYIYPCMTKNMLLFWCFSVFSSVFLPTCNLSWKTVGGTLHSLHNCKFPLPHALLHHISFNP